jgi:hypothetical protein
VVRALAEAALARVEFRHRFFQIGPSEIGPHRAGKQQFGVGALPKQEIAQPLLSAGTDQQVHVRRIAKEAGKIFPRGAFP